MRYKHQCSILSLVNLLGWVGIISSVLSIVAGIVVAVLPVVVVDYYSEITLVVISMSIGLNMIFIFLILLTPPGTDSYASPPAKGSMSSTLW